MARKHPSHTTNHNRRTRPIGPVNGLAIARALPHAPVWEDKKYEDAPGYNGGQRLVSTKQHWHPMSMHAQLVAVNGAGIGLPQVDRQLRLTPRQRALATYSQLGQISWPGNPPLDTKGYWEDMLNENADDVAETPTNDRRLLVVRLMLHHNGASPGQAAFAPQPQAWAIADSAQHLIGETTNPAGGLMVSARIIDQVAGLIPATPPMREPDGPISPGPLY